MMGLVSGNRLNRFWQKGVKPIKDAIGVLSALSTVDKSTLVAAINELADGKLDVEKLVASTNITEPGFAMDGKTASEAFAELYSKNGYSFEETCVGTWVDGKPMYRKTIIQSASEFVESESRLTYTVPHNTPNILNILAYRSFMQSGGTTYSLPYILASSGICDTAIVIVDRARVIISNKSDWRGYNLVVTMEYTKITD